MNIAMEQKLSPKQVTALYGISCGKLCDWRKTGQGPAYMQPCKNKVIYLQSDCEQFFKNLRVEPKRNNRIAK